MASGYVLQCNDYFVFVNGNGGVTKSKDKKTIFATKEDANKIKTKAPSKTKNYELRPYPETTENVAQEKNKPKITRKQYSDDVRKLVYHQAKGGCAICGKPLSYDEMTLDHIIPLAEGGMDDVSNLQCTHLQCNQMKGHMMSRDFIKLCITISMFQLNKRYGKDKEWISARKHFFKIGKKKTFSFQ